MPLRKWVGEPVGCRCDLVTIQPRSSRAAFIGPSLCSVATGPAHNTAPGDIALAGAPVRVYILGRVGWFKYSSIIILQSSSFIMMVMARELALTGHVICAKSYTSLCELPV